MQEPDVGAQVEALVHAQETALSSRLEQWESGDGSLDEVPALIARLRYLRTARGLVAELTT
jgi:hypothetical protein